MYTHQQKVYKMAKVGNLGACLLPPRLAPLCFCIGGGVSQLSPTGIKFPGDSVIERGTGSYAIRVECPVPNSVLPPEKPACPAQSYLQGLSLPRDYVTLCLELQETWEPPSDPSPARLRPKLSTPSMSTHAWLLYLQVSAPGLA